MTCKHNPLIRTCAARIACAALVLIVSLGLWAKKSDPIGPATHHLMPVPASVEFGGDHLALASGFRVAVTGFSDARLQGGIARALRRLEGRTGLALSADPTENTVQATLVIHADGPGMKVQGIEENESYSLEINERQAVLNAGTVVGALRGLETLLQLFDEDKDGFFFPVVRIQDRPRFAWRGLMIDVSRHWEPVDVIERNLDAMAAVKLNVFHWHLSDDQGFRIESKRYPKLQRMGSDGLYYTQEQVRAIVHHARERGIRVVPEFDMPGHSTAWFVGYPQYASAPGPYAIERRFGIFDPSFDPTREPVYQFLDGFIGEMVGLFPDAYWHIGGDENNGKQWDANPRIRAFKKRHGLKNNAALQAYFNRRLLRILQKHGKRMVGWDEILDPDLPKDIVIQSWRGRESLAAAATQGFSGILSAGYYLDAMQTAQEHYAVDPLPAEGNLSPERAARILGGETCMWGELITPDNIDSHIWPRTAAIAERLWSPAKVTDAQDMYRRLQIVNTGLEEAGVRHLSGPDVMLRRLAGTEAIEPLQELLRFVEPLGLSDREEAHAPTQLTPLVTLADIASPDVLAKRDLGKIVDSFLRDPKNSAVREALARQFTGWRDLQNLVDSLAQHEPQLHDAQEVARQLSELGAAGEEALGYVARGKKAPKEWTEAKMALMKGSSDPATLVRIAVVPPVQKLVEAAGGTS